MLYRALTVIFAIVLGLLCIRNGYADSLEVGIGYDNADFVISTGAMTAAKSRQALDRISIPGFSSTVSSGNPALPCKIIYVALPPDADPGTVKIDAASYSTKILPGEYDIAPVPAAAAADESLDWGQGKQITNGRNTLVYDNNAFYPFQHLRVSEVGQMRSWKVAAIEYWPYCYNPTTGELREVEADNISITYDTLESDSIDSIADPVAVDMSSYISNNEQAASWYASTAQVSSVGTMANGAQPCYVIITTQAIASASSKLGDFINYQALRGFNVKVSTESDWGGGIGDGAANNIRNWLKNNYLKLNIEYVLFIGNPNPISGNVPMKMLWPKNNEASYKEAPSDYYFADLTGNWDLDNDGRYGEEQGDLSKDPTATGDFGTGGIDKFPEVYVGRIPYYGNIGELDHILQKTIDHGSTQPSLWRHNILLPMKPFDTITQSYQLGELIKSNVADKVGFKSTRVYDSTYSINPPPESIPCEDTQVKNEWLKGAGLVFWMAHGSVNLASGVINSYSCPSLNDSMPSIVYAGSCYNGKPEDSDNLGYALLLHGAISVVSASRVSWYFPGESVFTSSDSIGGIGYQYARCLLSQKDSCGQALMNTHLAVPTIIWSNNLVFNLYGDPSIVIDSVAPGGVCGKITTPDGTPIENAVIKSADGARNIFSAKDGTYLLCGFSSGTQDIQVSADGYYSRQFYNVPITSGRPTSLNVCLNRAICGSISGYVRDANGMPIADAVVKTGNGGNAAAYTLSDGSFQLSNLTPGVYAITAYKYPYAEKGVYDIKVTEGCSSEVEIALKSYEANVLTNGDFDDGYASSNSGTLANCWQFYQSSGFYGYPLIVNTYHKSGVYSQRITLLKSQIDGHAGVYHVADVVPGASYSLTAWARLHFCGDGSSNVVCRLGYDPTGGINPASANIVWTQFTNNPDFWYSLFKTIVPYSQTITIFLDAWCKEPTQEDCYAYFDWVGLTGPARSPSVPSVWISQYDKTSVSASWSSPDLDISSYEYAISATADASGIVAGGEWQNAGLSTSAVRTGLNLQNSEPVRVLVRAKNEYGLQGEIGASDPVKVITDILNVASAKQMPDGSLIRINNLQVSRMGFGAECYLEDMNRVAGIKVKDIGFDTPYLQSNTLTSVIGRLSSENGLLVLSDAQLFPSIVGAPLKSLGMLNKNIGSSSPGLSSCGLLVTVWGRVGDDAAESLSSGCFTIKDGSTPDGIVVECFNSAVPPEPGSYVRVTGISIPEGVAVYSADDIVPM